MNIYTRVLQTKKIKEKQKQEDRAFINDAEPEYEEDSEDEWEEEESVRVCYYTGMRIRFLPKNRIRGSVPQTKDGF